MRRYGFAFTLACLCVCISANSRLIAATMITSDDDPLLDDAVVITFDEVPLGTQDPTIRGVSFVGLLGPVEIRDGTTIFPTAPNLNNDVINSTGTTFDISLPEHVVAFGLDLYAVNYTTTLEAFNDKQELLGVTELFADFAPISGFRGIATNSPISTVRVTTSDFIIVDNFHVVISVPESSSLALITFAISVLGPHRPNYKVR